MAPLFASKESLFWYILTLGRVLQRSYYTGMDKTCVYTIFYGFICVSGTDCVQVRYRHIRQAAIPARVVLGTAVFCDKSNQYLIYEFPFCAMHMCVSSMSLPYLQNRLPSLIISAILAQYSSLCDHLVLHGHKCVV